MYTLIDVDVTKPLLISYIAEKAGVTQKEVSSFLEKETMFKWEFYDTLEKKTTTLEHMQELAETYIVFSSSNFYK